jgi:hypothetical protein
MGVARKLFEISPIASSGEAMKLAHALAVSLFVVQAAGCGKSITAPQGLKSAPPVEPPPTTILTGAVSDRFGEPLAGARVQIVGGRQDGRSTTTDDSGSFVLMGAFDDASEARAMRDGYADGAVPVAGWWRFDSIRPPVSRSFNFILEPPLESGQPVLMPGDQFTLTLAADAGCTAIPADLRTRTYDVTVSGDGGPAAPANTWFSLVASGKEFLEGHDYFPVNMTGTFLHFLLNEDGFPYLSERIGSNGYLSFDGEAFASRASRGSVITASAAGVVDYCEVSAPVVGYYELADRECPAPGVNRACGFSKVTLSPR